MIGTPVDRAYPTANALLQARIHRDHLLISQFAPGAPVFRSNFSVVENPSVTWPGRFLAHRRTRVLAKTEDVLDALKTSL